MNKHVEKPTEAQTERVRHENIVAAISAAQSDLKDPTRDKVADIQGEKAKFKFKYADLEGALIALRPIWTKHGLAPLTRTRIDNGMLIYVFELKHETGDSVTSEYPVCSVNTTHQRMGMALTYARRQCISATMSIASSDDTDAAHTGTVNEAPRQKMSAHAAKTEINWAAIQETIDKATTFEKLSTIAKRVEDNNGIWPDSYVSQARERIGVQRLAIAADRMAAAKDVDQLHEAFTEMEVVLEGLVPWDELAALHKKHETRILG